MICCFYGNCDSGSWKLFNGGLQKLNVLKLGNVYGKSANVPVKLISSLLRPFDFSQLKQMWITFLPFNNFIRCRDKH